MKMKTRLNKTMLLLPMLAIMFACSGGNGKYDATGTFEAEEVIEGHGKAEKKGHRRQILLATEQNACGICHQ